MDLHHRRPGPGARRVDQRRRPASRARRPAWLPDLRDGRCLPDPVFRRRLAQAEADVEVAKLMGYEAASMLDSGRIPTVEVSVEKIFTSELRQRIADLAIDLLGPGRAAVALGELLRAAVPGVAADALRWRHQRGAARRDRPARSRDAVVRAVTACE